MARRKRKSGRRNKKIPVATVAGVMLSAKHVFEQYGKIKAASPDMVNDHMLKVMTGYVTPALSAAGGGDTGFHAEELLKTYGPAVAGRLVSTYVGGPKGLNINSALRGVPMVKL